MKTPEKNQQNLAKKGYQRDIKNPDDHENSREKSTKPC